MTQEAETAMNEVTATCSEIGFANRAIFIEDLRGDYKFFYCIGYVVRLPLIVTNYENQFCKDSA
jgi:hypothetical protein